MERKITGEWLAEAKECFKQLHEGKTSPRAFIIDLNRINNAVKKDLKGGKWLSIWFRFYRGDTGAYTIQNIENYLSLWDGHNNKKYLLECIEVAVMGDSLQMYYS